MPNELIELLVEVLIELMDVIGYTRGLLGKRLARLLDKFDDGDAKLVADDCRLSVDGWLPTDASRQWLSSVVLLLSTLIRLFR